MSNNHFTPKDTSNRSVIKKKNAFIGSKEDKNEDFSCTTYQQAQRRSEPTEAGTDRSCKYINGGGGSALNHVIHVVACN